MKKEPVVIKNVVEEVIRNLGAGKVSQAETLEGAWTKAVGRESLRHARPVEIKGNVLIVHVDSSSWLHKLSMERVKILSQLKDDLGDGMIEDIKLRIGEL